MLGETLKPLLMQIELALYMTGCQHRGTAHFFEVCKDPSCLGLFIFIHHFYLLLLFFFFI